MIHLVIMSIMLIKYNYHVFIIIIITIGHREVVVKSAIKGEQLQKQVKKDSVNLTELESLNSLSGNYYPMYSLSLFITIIIIISLCR
jgi:hypothetical protein